MPQNTHGLKTLPTNMPIFLASYVSHEKQTSYFPLNPDCLIRILIIVYCNPHMGVSENREFPKMHGENNGKPS